MDVSKNNIQYKIYTLNTVQYSNINYIKNVLDRKYFFRKLVNFRKFCFDSEHVINLSDDAEKLKLAINLKF